MAHATVLNRRPDLALVHHDLLPGSRNEWPGTAQAAYRDVLRELDGWCRVHDWPAHLNAWIAEEAVRRS